MLIGDWDLAVRLCVSLKIVVFVLKTDSLGLERGFGGSEHFLIFQRIRVRFLAPGSGHSASVKAT